jgi:hypothetical protein
MTTLNKKLDELIFEFSDINGILHDAFSLGTGKSVSSIKNNSNTTRRKQRYNNIENITGGINVMQTKFSEAENELLNKSAAQIVSARPNTHLDTYQNNLPYGVPAGNQVNYELYAVGENTWEQFSKDMGKIFKKIGKEQLNVMTSNNSSLKGPDIENIVYGTCGSLGEWPQINPKSAGMGRCSKLFEVFNNHYKRYNGKIDESKFYSDLISSLYTSEIFALSGKKIETGITGFSSEVKVYNINTSLWFPTDEERTGKKAKYQGFLKDDEDSYGTFFDIGGFPIRYEDYIDAAKKYNIAAGAMASLRNTLTDREYDDDDTAIKGQSKKLSNGMYSNYSTDTNFLDNNSIVVAKNVKVVDGINTYDVNKKYCMLYKYEGDRTDINKLKEIELPKVPSKIGVESTASSYLFNYKNELNARKGYFITNRYNIQDTIITQAIIALIELYSIRKIFGLAYPENGIISAALVHHPNIFQINARMVGGVTDLTDARFNGSRYVENLDATKSRLRNVLNTQNITTEIAIFGEDSTKFNAHPTIVELRRLINSMDGTLGGLDATIHIHNIANCDQIIGMPVFRRYDRDTFYTDLIRGGHVFPTAGAGYQAGETFNFRGTTLEVMSNDNFINDPVQANNIKNPVLAYRFIMRRMVYWYKETYFRHGTPNDTNFSNLYRRNATNPEQVILTQARAQGGGYQNLENFKQAIPDINPIMVGGSRKSSSNNLIKTGGKKTKKIQKGGAADTLFTGNAPKLYANRKLMNFNPAQFELAVKKYKDLGFNANYNKVKSLFDKISQISHLPLFFDGYEDTLNISTNNGDGAAPESGGCGVVPPAGNTIPISFSDVAQLFLFNSVNTTTTTLLIHFLKNVKACLNHFITTDLKVASDKLSKVIMEIKADKVEGSLRELIKEIDKVVNFLKYNTLNLHEQSVRLDNDNLGVNVAHQFQNNEHYIKNLFLGANVYFSYNYANPNAFQSVIMRFTNNDLGDDGAGQNQVNWHGDMFFQFLNRIVGCTENSSSFGNTLKFLTDSNNPVNNSLHVYSTTPNAGITPALNPYLARIHPYLKEKPDGCFGGIPYVSLDPKTFSLLTHSFYLLLGLRLVVGKDIQKNDRIEEETAYSILSHDKQVAIRKNIQDTLTISAFSTLAESLKSQETINQANMIFNTIFRYLFIQSRRLIAQVNQSKQEINKAEKIGNKKNTKKGLFTGGGPATSIYTFRQTSNANMKNSLIKSQINFIKTTYQTCAEFEYMMDEILIQIKKEIERRGVKNELHFYYYIDTHFRNFKIYMTTYLLTIGDNNIHPEMAEKLQKYISYSPDKNQAVDSYKKLTQVPLIDPQYSDPLWWAKIERKFMDIQEIGFPSSDTVYRLFIITTTPPSKLKARDLYIVDAFALATLNNSKSQDKYWITTGDRTHVGIKKAVDSAKNKIYLDTNTIIKLTGIGSTAITRKPNGISLTSIGLKQNSTKARMMTPLKDKNINKAIRGAINEDIRDLISGKYKYFDKKDNRYKTLIPLFLQAGKNDLLQNIVSKQKDNMFRGYEHKFRIGTNSDYKIYQLSDDYIKDLKKYRQWLYQIFIEQQMQLTKPEPEKFDTIETTMISSFKGWLYTTNTTGKCTRIYNIYDYIVLQATDAGINATTGNKKMSNFRLATDHLKPAARVPNPIDFKSIRSPDPNLSNTYDLGAKMMAGFISRESLIKLMLIY